MTEESTTPDLAALWQQVIEAFVRRDFDTVMSLFAADSTYEAKPLGLTFEGRAAVRRFVEDWAAGYQRYEVEIVQSDDLGNDVLFSITDQDARPLGSPANVQEQWAFTIVWHDGVIRRVTASRDIDEGRAAAERLAQERGIAMSANLDLVRSIYAAWERGDFSRADWADPEIEYVHADGPSPGAWKGHPAMASAFRDWLSAWEDWNAMAEEYRELDDERVLVVATSGGRGKSSGLGVRQVTHVANLFQIRGGKVTRLVTYWSRDRALTDLGLEK